MARFHVLKKMLKTQLKTRLQHRTGELIVEIGYKIMFKQNHSGIGDANKEDVEEFNCYSIMQILV